MTWRYWNASTLNQKKRHCFEYYNTSISWYIKVLIYSCNSNLIQLRIANSHGKPCFHSYPKGLAKPRTGKTMPTVKQVKQYRLRTIHTKNKKQRSCLISRALCGTGESTAGDNSPEEAYMKYKSFKHVTLVPDSESIVPIPRGTKIQPGPNPPLHYLSYYRETNTNKSYIQQNLLLEHLY